MKKNKYIRGRRLERASYGTDIGCGTVEWHRACNAEGNRQYAQGGKWPRVMYNALKISDEVPRMTMLFKLEREHAMPSSFKLCAHDPRPATPLPDNHLRCALGVECRRCEYLAAIDRSDSMTPEAKDEAKAWTCATHFLLESPPDVSFDLVLWDKSDAAFECRRAIDFCDNND
jgi:hypothetical protein